jgi:hypothetical protein
MAFNWRKMRGLDVANLAISNVTQTRNPFDRAPLREVAANRTWQ